MSSLKNKISAGDTASFKGGSIDGGNESRQAGDGMSVSSKKVNTRKFRKESNIYGIPVKNMVNMDMSQQ